MSGAEHKRTAELRRDDAREPGMPTPPPVGRSGSRMLALTVGRLAKRVGTGVDTVRFYERIGLLPPPDRSRANYRSYTEADVERLLFIRRAKDLGFTLKDIGELLNLSAVEGTGPEAEAVLDRRVRELDSRIRHLSAIRDALQDYARRCAGPGAVGEGRSIMKALLSR